MARLDYCGFTARRQPKMVPVLASHFSSVGSLPSPFPGDCCCCRHIETTYKRTRAGQNPGDARMSIGGVCCQDPRQARSEKREPVGQDKWTDSNPWIPAR